MSISVCAPSVLPVTGPSGLFSEVGEKRKQVSPLFDIAQRRFGEHFDVSTHGAVIKMMMMILGATPADMFNQVTPSGWGYGVTMKDEFKVHVSHDELRQVTQASRFSGHDAEAVKAANFALAVFVKRKQAVGGYASFDQALAKSLQGETTLRCLQGMGVQGLTQYVTPSEMVAEGVVAVVDSHSLGSSLVVNGVAHHYADRRTVGNRYGYRLFPDKSRYEPPAHKAPVKPKPKDIWGGFYQGYQGNCVTVSAIKAAMMRFGQSPADIYRAVTATPAGYEVVMRDGFTLTLTREELDKARQGSHLRGSAPALLEDANFLYAVSAKRAQLDNNDFRAGESFEAAMGTLNDGEYPGQALRRLGLLGYLRESNVTELANGAIGTLADNDHSVAVIEGALDYYGSKYSLRSSSPWMNRGFRALKLI
ncbi:hypothetical protein [Pseudomonas lactucae]|uniref:Uncharacterized protein n=1 Tax=Pseudomonas lactucae TaxID=2813360 RepID=A0A9X0Y947_9PSED|nr:hypothetical protein [Pseudomonas lactucae]MBN2975843.1 hypothetical protein [Pseudomonas lactucae]MBN2988904.1 hypothetical protein [Pseudomonas lactucae]